MAHRTPKINDTVKFTDQQQAILNDAAEQLMEAGGLTALTQAHFNVVLTSDELSDFTGRQSASI